MAMHDPPHPGGVLRRQWFDPMRISVTSAATHLGVSRKALSELVNEHAGISPEMAVRLSIVLGTSSEMWMNMQSSYGLWQAEQRRDELSACLTELAPLVNKPVSNAPMRCVSKLRKTAFPHTKGDAHSSTITVDRVDEKSRLLRAVSKRQNLIRKRNKMTDSATKTPKLMEVL